MRQLLAAVIAAQLLVPAGASAAPLVSYEREGGFAGVPMRVTVTKAGVVRSTTGTGNTGERYTLRVRPFAKLKRVLRRAGFATLEADYRPALGTVADGFTHTITYKGKTVLSGDGGTAPARLDRAIAAVSALADQ